jgi:hypothetical protein
LFLTNLQRYALALDLLSHGAYSSSSTNINSINPPSRAAAVDPSLEWIRSYHTNVIERVQLILLTIQSSLLPPLSDAEVDQPSVIRVVRVLADVLRFLGDHRIVHMTPPPIAPTHRLEYSKQNIALKSNQTSCTCDDDSVDSPYNYNLANAHTVGLQAMSSGVQSVVSLLHFTLPFVHGGKNQQDAIIYSEIVISLLGCLCSQIGWCSSVYPLVNWTSSSYLSSSSSLKGGDGNTNAAIDHLQVVADWFGHCMYLLNSLSGITSMCTRFHNPEMMYAGWASVWTGSNNYLLKLMVHSVHGTMSITSNVPPATPPNHFYVMMLDVWTASFCASR